MVAISSVFPRRLDINGALKLNRQLEDLALADEYVFDFSQFVYAEPFGMLYAAAIVSAFVDRRHATLTGINLQNCGYQGHMGFFQSLGIEHGNKPGDAPGGTNYLPVTSISIAELKAEAIRQNLAVGDIVQRDAERMAERLTRSSRGDFFDIISYSIREMIRNVVEHSEAQSVQFCLQHWPTKNRVHLALLDGGIGIRRSLQANPHLKISSDLDALKLAIRPGVSGKMYDGVESNEDDRWENSGYGLYLTSRLAASSGNFWVFSGDTALAMEGERNLQAACALDGTAIRISLDTRKIENTRARVKKLADAGEKLVAFAGKRTAKSASLGSRVI